MPMHGQIDERFLQFDVPMKEEPMRHQFPPLLYKILAFNHTKGVVWLSIGSEVFSSSGDLTSLVICTKEPDFTGCSVLDSPRAFSTWQGCRSVARLAMEFGRGMLKLGAKAAGEPSCTEDVVIARGIEAVADDSAAALESLAAQIGAMARKKRDAEESYVRNMLKLGVQVALGGPAEDTE